MRTICRTTSKETSFIIADLPPAFHSAPAVCITGKPPRASPRPFQPAHPTPDVTDFGSLAASRLEVVRWRGHEVRVPPLDLQLEVSKRRGLIDRVAKIQSRISTT